MLGGRSMSARGHILRLRAIALALRGPPLQMKTHFAEWSTVVIVLFLSGAPYSRFLFTGFGSNKLCDDALRTLHELHRRHTYAPQEGCLRASYEQSICRMRTVLDEQLITGHRYHHLAARGDLILSCVLCKDVRSDFHSADEVCTRALILANILQQHRVGHESLIGPQCERMRKRLRIIDGHLILEVPEISSPQAFGESQGLCLR